MPFLFSVGSPICFPLARIVNYLDSKQWDDGGGGYWEPSHLRPMMSREVLFAYFILNATPEKSLEPFLSQFDTWEEAGQYRNGRLSSAYHLIE